MSRCTTKPVNPPLFENGVACDPFYVNSHEKVYDEAWSGGRKPKADGSLPAVGDSVDLSIPSWSNDIGEAQLLALWQDPDFNAGIQAFYYADLVYTSETNPVLAFIGGLIRSVDEQILFVIVCLSAMGFIQTLSQ